MVKENGSEFALEMGVLGGANRPLKMAVNDTPQARFGAVGPAALSDSELLSLMLGNDAALALATAHAMLADAGSLATMADWDALEFLGQKGIGEVAARRLAAMFELARRSLRSAEIAPLVFNRPDLIHQHFQTQIQTLAVEKFWVLCLNRKNRLLKQVEVTSGTATSSLAHPREVFRSAIRYSATAIACVHNHPSGDPAPSTADVQMTRQLREAARAVDIELLDHVILGKASCDPRGLGYYSFRESGVL